MYNAVNATNVKTIPYSLSLVHSAPVSAHGASVSTYGHWYLSSFPDAGDVRFSLRDTTYYNNSLVALEDIGENDSAALLCVTDRTACCRPPYAGDSGNAIGNWFFPNKTRVPSATINYTSNLQWDFYRTRGQMVVLLHRRRGGVIGIYHCEIPNKMNVTQNLYVGVYTDNTGECMTTKMLAV